jgi:predicted oxidoreductase
MTSMSDSLPSPESRSLGKSGRIISPIAWGMWRFTGADIKTARSRVEAAFEAGITLFDTADIYGCDGGGQFGDAESLLGQVLAESPSLRDDMVLATKGGISLGVPYDSSSTYIEAAIDASLRRMGVDHIDLWQIHRPDILTHPSEIAAAIEKAHAVGKIGAVGVSNFTAAQIDALAAFLTLPIVSHQPEFSPLTLEPITGGLMDHAILRGMAVLAWSPLAGGRLAVPTNAREQAVVALLDAQAERYGVDRAAAAYSWIMAHPAAPIPIVGTQNPDRVRAAADALKPRWTRTEWYAVLQASMGERLP